MPYQNMRIYSSHYEWLSLIYDKADAEAILNAIREVRKTHVHAYDLLTCTSFKVVE